MWQGAALWDRWLVHQQQNFYAVPSFQFILGWTSDFGRGIGIRMPRMAGAWWFLYYYRSRGRISDRKIAGNKMVDKGRGYPAIWGQSLFESRRITLSRTCVVLRQQASHLPSFDATRHPCPPTIVSLWEVRFCRSSFPLYQAPVHMPPKRIPAQNRLYRGVRPAESVQGGGSHTD